jgi:8-oxo-dGTP pyrophosphatase MutT (NUDIX family)
MKKIICSGALFYTLSTNRFLFLHRAKSKRNDLWGLVGGTNEDSETPWSGLKREVEEEIGFIPDIKKAIPLESFISKDDHFNFHTYLCIVSEEFIPRLNDEHNGYAWVSFGKWPKPLHTGLYNTLKSKTNISKLETVFKLVDLIEKVN